MVTGPTGAFGLRATSPARQGRSFEPAAAPILVRLGLPSAPLSALGKSTGFAMRIKSLVNHRPVIKLLNCG